MVLLNGKLLKKAPRKPTSNEEIKPWDGKQTILRFMSFKNDLDPKHVLQLYQGLLLSKQHKNSPRNK